MMLRVLVAAVLTASLAWPAPPPAAPVKPVTNDYFGHKLVDRYRYFEHLDDPVVQRFFRRQADYTGAVLARLGPQREKIRSDVTRLADAGSAVSSVNVVNDRLFYFERPPGANDARLMVRDAPGTAPRLLLDPDELAKNTASKAHFSLSNLLPSPDGAFVAVGVVPGGAEYETHTRIVKVADGSLLREDFPRTWFGASAWTNDGKTIFYNQFPELKAGESENDRELRSMEFRHTLGATNPDVAVFGIGLDPKVDFVPTDFPFAVISPVSPYAVGAIAHGVQNEQTLYVARVSELLSNQPVAWRKIVDVDDDVTSFDLHGSTIYLLSHKDASHFKVEALDLDRTDETATNAVVAVPESDVVVQQVAVAGDGLYVRGIHGGLANLRKLPFNSDGTLGSAAAVALPFDGTLQEFATDGRVPGAALGLVSWTKPLLVYALDASGTLTDTGIRKPPHIDTSGYTSLEVQSQSADGTLVPLSIVMRRGTKLDGSNPTYLEAYGSYGLDIDPYFLGSRFAWLDRGGVFAVSHVRGGGENGESWHIAGKGPAKQHTIDDVVGAARYLIANRYTSAAHLAIEGTSAGGITVGGAITQHPELFAAALDVVGWTDGLRSEAAEPNGATNVPEFGSPKTEAGFEALYTMDAYQHVVDGTRYPAVMALTGINDPRVAPWQPAKFVARLQHASASGRPVLLRVDYDAGHGLLAASRAQSIALLTDEFSFLLWQCDSPVFAGIPIRIPAPSGARVTTVERSLGVQRVHS
jgi:prolyl oligopeptidase